MQKLKRLFVTVDDIVCRAIEVIQKGHEGIALVVDADGSLVATITDGDIRRAVLARINVDDNVQSLIDSRPRELQKPITAPIGAAKEDLLVLMKEKVLRQIPLLDEDEKIVGLALLAELAEEIDQPLSAVVMAGGFGKRLHPLTEDTPKPMLPLQGRPLLERTIEQLRKVGIGKICISTHHKSEVIMDHFGDGNDFGVPIDYVNEDMPLGTAGALCLMDKADHTFLVINGDIVTQLDFRRMLEFHHLHQAVMTVGIRKFKYKIPYGVVETDGVNITNLAEKPDYSAFVNAGIYMLEPEANEYIPNNIHFDMTDLIQDLLQDGRTVVAFPIQEYWLDIGNSYDYERVQSDLENGRL